MLDAAVGVSAVTGVNGMDGPAGGVEVREVDAGSWADFERLFESRGGPKWCWCMVFRRDERGKRPGDAAGLKQAMRAKVAGGVPVGLLAYADGEPVGWCSAAPRSTFVMRGVPPAEGDDDDTGRVWSITCFYVRSGRRRQGLMALLIEEAARVAKSHGAAVIEAYPVAPDSPSYRFGGFTPVFAALGFEEVGRVGSRRRVMRRRV